jgi:hypothetical protein
MLSEFYHNCLATISGYTDGQEASKIHIMEEHQHLPDANRLSVLASTILLAYALIPFVNIPGRDITINLPGIVLYFQVSFATVVSLLVAVLAAVGTDWLLQGHPHLGKRNTIQHWILPALTTWVIGVPLNTLHGSLEWWAVFAFGGILLVLVFVAEYVVVDLSDVRHAPATVGLTAVSFALFLTLAIAIRAGSFRLYLLLPALVIPMALVALRTLYLRLNGRWCVTWTTGIAFVIGQVVIGLHYWPLSPLSFGLILLGPSYGLTSMAGSLEEGQPWRTTWIEPALMMAVMWILAMFFKG